MYHLIVVDPLDLRLYTSDGSQEGHPGHVSLSKPTHLALYRLTTPGRKVESY